MPATLKIVPLYGDEMDTQSNKTRRPEPKKSYGADPILCSLVRYAEAARDRYGEPFSFEAATAKFILDLREDRTRSLTDYGKLFGWSRQQLRDRYEDLRAAAEHSKTPIENQTRTKQEPNKNQKQAGKLSKTPIENQTRTKQEPNKNQTRRGGKKERFPRTPSKERINTSPLTPQAGGTVGGEGKQGSPEQQHGGAEPRDDGQRGKDTGEALKTQPAQSRAAETPAELILTLQFPDHLRGDAVLEAFRHWIENRQGFRKPKQGWRKFFQNQINSLLVPLTTESAIATLTHCAANGYQGLFIRGAATAAQPLSASATGGGNAFWHVMSYHAALADATKHRYDGLPTHWLQFTGPDGKPYFVKPEHSARPMPEGFVRKGVSHA